MPAQSLSHPRTTSFLPTKAPDIPKTGCKVGVQSEASIRNIVVNCGFIVEFADESPATNSCDPGAKAIESPDTPACSHTPAAFIAGSAVAPVAPTGPVGPVQQGPVGPIGAISLPRVKL